MSTGSSSDQSGSPFDRFTERARKVMTLAQAEAKRFNHNYIGTEHLLLGLVAEGEGVAAKVLQNLGIELVKVRAAVEHIIGRGERQAVGEVGLTPRAKKVIELAVDEARQLRHPYIGTEHLLLGLMREGEGIAATVLESLNVNLESVRSEVIKVLTRTDVAAASPEERVSTGSAVSPTMHPAAQLQQWDYLVLRSEWRNAMPCVVSVDGPVQPSFAQEHKPIHEALGLLGGTGWELVGIDSTGAARAVPTALYALRRRK